MLENIGSYVMYVSRRFLPEKPVLRGSLRVYFIRNVIQTTAIVIDTVVVSLMKTCQVSNEPRRKKTCLRGFRPGSTQTGLYSNRRRLETNLKFRIKKVEGLYYLSSENKGADRTVYLCLCFLRSWLK